MWKLCSWHLRSRSTPTLAIRDASEMFVEEVMLHNKRGRTASSTRIWNQQQAQAHVDLAKLNIAAALLYCVVSCFRIRSRSTGVE
jgi:IS5 family transposase